MSPGVTFFSGLLALFLLTRYFTARSSRTKRVLGSVITVLAVALSLATIYPPKQNVSLGLDLQGGTSFLIRLVPEDGEQVRHDALDQAVEAIRKRVDQFGVSEPIITPQGADRILVQVPGLNPAQIAEARQQLAQVAKLEFRLVHPESDSLVGEIESGRSVAPPGYHIEDYSSENRNGKRENSKLLVKQRADILGNRVSSAAAIFDKHGWAISLEFDGEGSELFGKLTSAHVGERFAIVLDGVVQSAPVIRDGIYGGRASISGSFSEKEARNLAGVLENPLQTPVKIEEERSVSATLGADSIRSGVISGLLGLAATLLFVIVYYRFAGLVATVGLAVNLILIFGAMTMFHLVLTLPGIAGIILTIGMAVDANVLIYERLREELALGKPVRQAIEASYEKAFSAIFDSNLTTLITAMILFWKATGPIKGFAVTLSIGIVASMFSALIVTRNCFAWAVETDAVKRMKMSSLIKPTRFDFLGKRRISVAISAAVLLACLCSFGFRGERNFGVDFKGGGLLVFEAKEHLSEGVVRSALQQAGLQESVVQREKSAEKEFLTVRSAIDTGDKVEKVLLESFPGAGIRIEQKDKVGKLVGDELARNSLMALGLGMLGIFIYVAIQFEASFAIAAIIALLHDVLITIGAFALLDRELSLVVVGAVLTIAGYSINDTIVIFDRIRERLRHGANEPLATVMNQSINDTLSRTLLTSGTTLFSTAALYLWGGPVLHDFAFAIIIGIVVGTYSSIFVASPIILWWAQFRDKRAVRATSSSTIVSETLAGLPLTRPKRIIKGIFAWVNHSKCKPSISDLLCYLSLFSTLLWPCSDSDPGGHSSFSSQYGQSLPCCAADSETDIRTSLPT